MAKKGQFAPTNPLHDRDYQAEDDHRTMMRASEIQQDKGRMTGVQRHQRKQQKAMNVLSRTIGMKR